jgi:hypothetical protein
MAKTLNESTGKMVKDNPLRASKPKPSTPPGTNSFGRTYQEQNDYERSQRSKNIGKGESNPILDFIDGLMGRKKTPVKTVAPGKGASKKAALKKAATKKKSVIPASPTN